MKRRLIAAALIYPVLLIFSAMLACNLHYLMSGQLGFVWQPRILLDTLLHIRNAQRFFLVFAGLSLLLIIAVMVSSAGVKYHNTVRKITPQITIPEASGRGEYGTAKFMSRRQVNRQFAYIKIKRIRGEVKEHEKGHTAGRDPAGLE